MLSNTNSSALGQLGERCHEYERNIRNIALGKARAAGSAIRDNIGRNGDKELGIAGWIVVSIIDALNDKTTQVTGNVTGTEVNVQLNRTIKKYPDRPLVTAEVHFVTYQFSRDKSGNFVGIQHVEGEAESTRFDLSAAGRITVSKARMS